MSDCSNLKKPFIGIFIFFVIHLIKKRSKWQLLYNFFPRNTACVERNRPFVRSKIILDAYHCWALIGVHIYEEFITVG